MVMAAKYKCSLEGGLLGVTEIVYSKNKCTRGYWAQKLTRRKYAAPEVLEGTPEAVLSSLPPSAGSFPLTSHHVCRGPPHIFATPSGSLLQC